MLPDLTVLLAILLGLMRLGGEPPDPWMAVGGTIASILVAVSMTWMAGERGIRGVTSSRRAQALSGIRWVGFWPILGWVSALSFFDWGAFVADLLPRETWIARYLVLFLPAAVLFVVGWVQRGRIEAAATVQRGAVVPAAGIWETVRQALKRNAIALLPMLVIIAILDGIWVLGELGVPGLALLAAWMEAVPTVTLAVMLMLLAAVSFFLPAILRRIFATEPLPAGPTRALLERHARALDLRYRDILLWKTKGLTLNALVVGFTPGTRLILITDGILRHLPEEEVLAVFSHEAGHAKRFHLPLFLVLFVATSIVFQVAGDLLSVFDPDGFLIVAAHLAFLWFVLLGVVSRLFEREADQYGADHAADLAGGGEAVHVPGLGAPLPAGASYMIRALERIRMLSGRGKSHRHGSIEERVHNLATQATDPAVRRGFESRLKRLHFATLGVCLVAGLLLAWHLPGTIRLGRAHIAFADGIRAYEKALEERKADREDAAGPLWDDAFADFTRTAEILQGRTDLPAEGLAASARFNAADTVFHGLDDEVRGARLFDEVLASLEESGLSKAGTRWFRFNAHIDRGRAFAHAGDPAAFEAWRRASASLPTGSGVNESWTRARLQLLRAVLLVRVEAMLLALQPLDRSGLLEDLVLAELGDVRGQGRAWLEALANRTDEGREWDEIRRDARRELARLGSDQILTHFRNG